MSGHHEAGAGLAGAGDGLAQRLLDVRGQRAPERARYGPTGRMEWVGPVGKGTLEPCAHDKAAMAKLWALSEEKTGLSWSLV